ncbi:hypothetical protein TTHERM_000295049 (macronuclear) [Tetrahymena thermophila SB210]|uniref:Uncharacterized protein n=1 Tax=Tetrahymena thermophila (strain SB210) TaxID=312017 RepID=W7X6W1_TETTS|nr:hypothetical protein TTHERM_000295049 [Tetrahymena thermophila SB210]EWS75115.1 hypothetical protein TTHERM_000295049 [Tetrahymena thermophila SB210]|eukprot:XP_012652353.1 hypothetical protein TTHERM_000295049 [Tetrahymena thermophila SB210]
MVLPPDKNIRIKICQHQNDRQVQVSQKYQKVFSEFLIKFKNLTPRPSSLFLIQMHSVQPYCSLPRPFPLQINEQQNYQISISLQTNIMIILPSHLLKHLQTEIAFKFFVRNTSSFFIDIIYNFKYSVKIIMHTFQYSISEFL